MRARREERDLQPSEVPSTGAVPASARGAGAPPQAAAATRAWLTRSLAIEAVIVAALFVVILAAWCTFVEPKFFLPYYFMQFLPLTLLRDDLARSLLDLHMQPPLLNFVLGLALKGSTWTGLTASALLFPIQAVVGLVSVLALWLVAVRTIASRPLRVAAMLLVVGNPYLYRVVNWFFYTLYELLLLSVLAAASWWYFERPRWTRLLWVAIPGLLLVYTRALFHPLWLVLVLIGLVWHARSTTPAWRPQLAAALVVVVVLSAWPAKNLARFGFFGYSSWLGYNFANGMAVEQPDIWKLFQRRGTDSVDPALVLEADARIPARLRDEPAVTVVTKGGGWPNMNHYAVIGASRALGANAMALIRRDPWELWRKMERSYLNGYCAYEGRDVYNGPLLRGAMPWARAYENVILLRLGELDPNAEPRIWTGYAVVFPALLVAAVVVLWRRRGRWTSAERVVALMLLCVVWMLAMVVVVDGYEGNRMRYSTTPLFILASTWTVRAIWEAGGSALRHRREASWR